MTTAGQDVFRNWVLGISAVASVGYGGWIGTQLVSISHSLGTLEGRSQCPPKER